MAGSDRRRAIIRFPGGRIAIAAQKSIRAAIFDQPPAEWLSVIPDAVACTHRRRWRRRWQLARSHHLGTLVNRVGRIQARAVGGASIRHLHPAAQDGLPEAPIRAGRGKSRRSRWAACRGRGSVCGDAILGRGFPPRTWHASLGTEILVATEIRLLASAIFATVRFELVPLIFARIPAENAVTGARRKRGRRRTWATAELKRDDEAELS